MRYCITGGCGFIGTNLIDRLLQGGRGVGIRVVDDLSASRREDLGAIAPFRDVDAHSPGPVAEQGLELLVTDIRDGAMARRAVEGADVVVHLAACTGVLPSVENPLIDCETNVVGTVNYLDAARLSGVTSFVLASSGAPLGEQSPPIHEEKVPRPLSPYGASKLAGEAYCHAFHGSYGLQTVALRFGNVYGPRSAHKQSLVAKFIKLALAGKSLTIYGDGSQTRDFIFIDDLVRAVNAAVEAGIGGEVFQIATHRETTVTEAVELLATVLRDEAGLSPEIVHTAPMKGEIQRNFSDIGKARRMLGWEPRIDLEEGLRRTVRWFLEAQEAGSR